MAKKNVYKNVNGTRDFFGSELYKRNYIISIIKEVFEKHRFLPLETPCFENNDVLFNKYGEEGDMLIYKILNSGDFTKNVDEQNWVDKEVKPLSHQITSKSMRYDLTIPMVRYFVQNQHSLPVPFKRYQIQNVWRADRPQKGRFREFLQCDADILGVNSLLQDIQLMQIYREVFSTLQLEICIKINHRQILMSFLDKIQVNDPNNKIKFLNALDKLDKIGLDKTLDLIKDIVSTKNLEQVKSILQEPKSIDFWETYLSKEHEGVLAMQKILNYFSCKKNEFFNIEFDFTLIRGLDYYTGSIYEIKAKNIALGSIGAGGRYDNLLSSFGAENISGIGISFGIDRIMLYMDEMKKYPQNIETQYRTKYLFLYFSEEESIAALPFIDKLREKNHKVDTYYKADKISKQIQFALKNNVENIVFYGKDEIEKGHIMVKKLDTQEQRYYKLNQL